MSRAPSLFMLLLLLALLQMMMMISADQNLRLTTCPLCNMDVKADINATILGNQHIYACEMAGHIDSLRTHPSSNLGQPEQVDIKADEIYNNATNMRCPVCGLGFERLTHAVPWISKGAQKIYTCSEEHAQLVFSNPTRYFAAQTSSDDFCNAGGAANPTGAAMFNGFQLAIGGDASCLLLLFQPWVISSAVKYAFAFLGVVLLAMSLEGFGKLRDFVAKRLYRDYGIVSSQTDYTQLATPQVSSIIKGRITGHVLLDRKVSHVPNASQRSTIRRLPLKCKLVLTLMYMLHLCLGYWVMLVIMSFETLMFVAVIVGIGLGFIIFKDIDDDELSDSIDPCCST